MKLPVRNEIRILETPLGQLPYFCKIVDWAEINNPDYGKNYWIKEGFAPAEPIDKPRIK